MGKGIFVVLEGVDRCGKTWQAELLEERLKARGIPVSRFSTPDYGGFAGREIGEQLVGKRIGDFLGLECLQLANRYEVASRIVESLVEGQTVICVRWSQSAELYGEISGQDVEAIRRACSFLPIPDLNILIDVDPMEIAERYDRRNTYEQDLAVQVRLSHAYRRMWGTCVAPASFADSETPREGFGLVCDPTIPGFSSRSADVARGWWAVVNGKGDPTVISEHIDRLIGLRTLV